MVTEIKNRILSNKYYSQYFSPILEFLDLELFDSDQDNSFIKLNIDSEGKYPMSFWFGINQEENKLFFSLNDVFNVLYYEDLSEEKVCKEYSALTIKTLRSLIKEKVTLVDNKIQNRSIEIIHDTEIIEKYSYKYFNCFFKKKTSEIKTYSPWIE